MPGKEAVCTEGKGVFVRENRTRGLRLTCLSLFLILACVGCGYKAPPQPRHKHIVSSCTTMPTHWEGTTLTRVIVTGATGRMGRRVIDLLRTDATLQLAGALTHATHTMQGRDIGEVAGTGPLGVPLSADLAALLPQTDVIIDFSVPEAALTYLEQAAVQGKAMVIGTTGFTAAQRDSIARLSQQAACLVAPNLSIGMQVMFQVMRQLVTLLGPGYDIEILEMHHRMKADAPSGTALRLANIVAETRGQHLEDIALYGRHGMVGRRSATEVAVQALRAGDIVGEHTVIFGGIGERLELIHRSQSRDTFAQGALRAAHWLAKQPPGLYGMEHVVQTL